MKKVLGLVLFSLTLVSWQLPVGSLQDVKSEYVVLDDSIQIHYKIWDNGKRDCMMQTICFVHGFGCDLNTWEKQFEGLKDEQNLRLVFVDLPGYGNSSKPHVEYTLDFFARSIDLVLTTNKIGPAIFVGHSLGTPICKQLLLNGNHLSGMVDIDGVYCFYDGNETQEYLEAINTFGNMFTGEECKDVITGFVESLVGPATPKEITDYARSIMPATPEYVANSTMRNLIDRKWWPQFGLPLEVLVICTQNSGLDSDNREKVQRLFPKMDYTELTTCGHFIHMEEPDMLNKKLKDYADLLLKNALEDFDFAVLNLEKNYAGFEFKVTDENSAQWEEAKKELRELVACGGNSPQEIISDLCSWFRDYHLSCTFRYGSDRFHFKPRYYTEIKYRPSKISTRVNKDTWLLRFPTWNGDEIYERWVSDAILEYKESGCKNLIVDLRGNSGGNDSQYQPLLSLLYKKVGKTDAMYMRNTKDNRERTRNDLNRDEFWCGLMDKAESDSAEYTLLFTQEEIKMHKDPQRPKKTAVLFDQLTASSAEQLLIELRAVAPDVKFFSKDNTMGCIDISNVRKASLLHAPNSLCIPVTVSQRVIEKRNQIDGIGIKPDVRITLPLPEQLTDNIDTWVEWVSSQF